MADIAKKDEKDLQKELALKQKALREFRFNIAGSKTKNIKEGRTLQRDIARLMTEIRSRAKRA